MKTILLPLIFGAAAAAQAQDKPPSCDDLKGLEKQACLKKGGTVQANFAPTDYARDGDKKRESR